MRVAAEDRESARRMCASRRGDRIAEGAARKEGQPVIIGRPALVQARFAKRRDVGQDHDVGKRSNGQGEKRGEMCRRFVAELPQLLPKQRPWHIHKVADQPEIVQKGELMKSVQRARRFR